MIGLLFSVSAKSEINNISFDKDKMPTELSLYAVNIASIKDNNGIDVSNLASRTYIVQMQNKNNKKIVKNWIIE